MCMFFQGNVTMLLTNLITGFIIQPKSCTALKNYPLLHTCTGSWSCQRTDVPPIFRLVFCTVSAVELMETLSK
jgi:hypothetical protein